MVGFGRALMPIPRLVVALWRSTGVLAYRPLRVLTTALDSLSSVPRFADREPDLAHPVSQLATQRQCDSPLFDFWCDQMGVDAGRRYDRKVWEWVYTLQVLETHGLLRPGTRGLGFGVGREPLAALMAKRGCDVVATDLPAAADDAAEWSGSGQHAAQLADLNPDDLCPPDVFAQRVRFRPMDMRRVDPSLRGFDFVWSSCALEHLGTLQRGVEFIRASLDTLRPGGVAVHTTEYNAGSNSLTLPAGSVVLYRRRDIVRLADDLRRDGHAIELNLSMGSDPIDRFVDTPPYHRGPNHLKLVVGTFVATSLGLTIRKAQNSAGS